MRSHKFYEQAYRAHYWTSFSPEKRAESEITYYEEIIKEFQEAGKNWAIERFEKLYIHSLRAKSRCASSMITGSARFPVARQKKYNNWEQGTTQAMLDYVDKVRKWKEKTYKTKEEELLETKNELTQCLKNQEIMKQANKLIRAKNEAGLSELLGSLDLMQKQGWWGAGYAPFELSLNLAKIKRLQDKIQSMETKAEKSNTEKDFDLFVVRWNYDIDRLQLLFEGKPEKETIALLKSKAFKWSPNNQAWQRQLTKNAENATAEILKTLKGKAA